MAAAQSRKENFGRLRQTGVATLRARWTSRRILDADADSHENPHVSHRIHKFQRDLKIRWTENPVSGSGAAFLWGPRQVGNHASPPTTPRARFYDLLDTELPAESLSDRSFCARRRSRIVRRSWSSTKPRRLAGDSRRSIGSFLQVMGLTHGQQVNYTNIARESGVSAATEHEVRRAIVVCREERPRNGSSASIRRRPVPPASGAWRGTVETDAVPPLPPASTSSASS